MNENTGEILNNNVRNNLCYSEGIKDLFHCSFLKFMSFFLLENNHELVH